jgi:uncharacterized Zn-binding protein involved in type VI secretion
MATVAIHPPKTPVHKGIRSIAQATIPNICKMPGPPAPFVPAPLPNIAKSELSPKNYSTTVEIEGNIVAIRGATYESIGDMASKGTGGGLISANCHGPAKFIAPGSMTVKIEGKNVHLLGDSMLNNCGPSGSPPNTGATMAGTFHAQTGGDNPCATLDCDKPVEHHKFDPDTGEALTKTITRSNGAPMTVPEVEVRASTDCEKEQICNKIKQFNKDAKAGKFDKRLEGQDKIDANNERSLHLSKLNKDARADPKNAPKLAGFWTTPGSACDKKAKKKAKDAGYRGHSPDHIQDVGLKGPVTDAANMKWMQSDINSQCGGATGRFDPDAGHTGVATENCCKKKKKKKKKKKR